MRLPGWFCLPTYARSQPDQQHFFLNGRPLRDKLVASAVRLAYRDVLFHGRHPAYVLYLEMEPPRVDVNAHPQKLEVRFREPGLVHDFLFRTLERALAETRPREQRGRRFRQRALGRFATATGSMSGRLAVSALDRYAATRPVRRHACGAAGSTGACAGSPATRPGRPGARREHPLGYAIAQLARRVHPRAGAEAVSCWSTCMRRTSARPTSVSRLAHPIRRSASQPLLCSS